MSEDLIDWLRAQIDLDQQKAAAFSVGTWVRRGQRDVYSLDGDAVAAGADRAEADFIADHDPARVLREVESLRKIIDNCSDWIENPVQGWEIDRADELTLKLDVGPTLLRLLAAIFSGRPGFREEWRPQ